MNRLVGLRALSVEDSYEGSRRLHDVLEHRRRAQHASGALRAPRELAVAADNRVEGLDAQLPPAAVTRTVRAPPGIGSVVSSVRVSRSTRFGASRDAVRDGRAGDVDRLTAGADEGSLRRGSNRSGNLTKGLSLPDFQLLAHKVFADGVEPPLSDPL